MNETEMLDYIKKYDLKKCLNVILQQSIFLTSAINPYHNNFHALCVFYNAMKIVMILIKNKQLYLGNKQEF